MRVCLHKGWRIAACILIAACTCAIFLLSGQDGETSASLSSKITAHIMETLTGHAPDVDSDAFMRAHHTVRKLAHATEYSLLSASFALLTHTYALSCVRRYGIPALACLPVAALDEFLQTFRVQRVGSPLDVCIDMAGAVTALALFALLWRIAINRRRARTS